MSFKDRPWKERVQPNGMGDESEAMFDLWAMKNRIAFAPYGLNRPPLRVYRLPDFVRYTPDRITTKHLVECQGLGRDQVFKLKCGKLGALREWDDIMPVKIFQWDSHKNRYLYEDLEVVDDILGTYLDKRSFHDGNEYWACPADDFDWRSD